MIELQDIAKPFGAQGFLVGFGVAALAYFLAPPLKKTFQPVIDKGAKGIAEFGSKAKDLFKEGNQKIKDKMRPDEKTESKIPEFAQEMIKISKGMEEQREESFQIMRDLKDVLTGLKEEMAEMKKGMQAATQ